MHAVATTITISSRAAVRRRLAELSGRGALLAVTSVAALSVLAIIAFIVFTYFLCKLITAFKVNDILAQAGKIYRPLEVFACFTGMVQHNDANTKLFYPVDKIKERSGITF